jgi:hypothetical protein
MHWQQGGERKVEKSCIASLEPIPWINGEVVLFFCIFGFWGCGLLCEIGRTGLENRSDRFWWNRSDRFWELAWPICALSWHFFRVSSCVLWWVVLFAWAWFCLGCVDPLSLPKGSETCLLQVIWFFAVIGFRSVVGVFPFVSFLFPFLFVYQMCVLSMHSSRGDWGPCVVRGPVDGRFLVWWVINSVVWTDSWLSITGAGCGLTGVGGGEEQARKVVAGEASRCGEDK